MELILCENTKMLQKLPRHILYMSSARIFFKYQQYNIYQEAIVRSPWQHLCQ